MVVCPLFATCPGPQWRFQVLQPPYSNNAACLTAENLAIKHYDPVFNTQLNPNPGTLAMRRQQWRDDNCPACGIK